MNMKHVFLILIVFISTILEAQVPRNVVVEVFTNTRCSTCGVKDPGIFRTIHKNPDLIQIAYYPSSPYSNCFFSQQNRSEYDGRTRNYAVYGSTPRVFVQGTEVNNNLDSIDLAPALGQMSNFEVRVTHAKTSTTMAQITTTIFKRAADTTTLAKLYVAAGEDSIVYSAPNGVPVHYGVMRKAMTDSSGMIINLPSLVGDSVSIAKSYTISIDWNQALLSGYGFVMNPTTKVIINANKAKLTGVLPNAIEHIKQEFSLSIAPNPANDRIFVNSDIQLKEYSILDLLGRMRQRADFTQTAIAIETLPTGVYLLAVKAENGAAKTLRFIKSSQ
jgi:hypothetical protein